MSNTPETQTLTPRTDAFFRPDAQQYPAANFARQLEKEVNQLKSALEKIADSKYWWHENDQPKEFSTPDAHEARKALESLK